MTNQKINNLYFQRKNTYNLKKKIIIIKYKIITDYTEY